MNRPGVTPQDMIRPRTEDAVVCGKGAYERGGDERGGWDAPICHSEQDFRLASRQGEQRLHMRASARSPWGGHAQYSSQCHVRSENTNFRSRCAQIFSAPDFALSMSFENHLLFRTKHVRDETNLIRCFVRALAWNFAMLRTSTKEAGGCTPRALRLAVQSMPRRTPHRLPRRFCVPRLHAQARRLERHAKVL